MPSKRINARKANKGQSVEEGNRDALHNRDRPCSTALHHLASNFLMNDPLCEWLYHHIKQQEEEALTATNGGTAKKKRKKKKKKRTPAAAATALEVQTPNIVSTDEHQEENSKPKDNSGSKNVEEQDKDSVKKTPDQKDPPKQDDVAVVQQQADDRVEKQRRLRQKIVHRIVCQLLERHEQGEMGSDHHGGWREFLSLRQPRPNSSSISKTVVDSAVQSIGCDQCRRSVECFYQKQITCRGMVALEGLQVGTRHDIYRKQDEEHQYSQYQLLMEEGTPRGQRGDWVIENDSEGNWQLRLLESDSYAERANGLAFLIEHYVLLQGLSPDKVLMVDDQERINQNLVYSRDTDQMASLDHELNDLAHRLEALANKFNLTRDHDREQIETSSFQIMKEVDESLDDTYEALLRIALETTRKVFKIKDGYGENATDEINWATEQCAVMWQELLQAWHQQFQALDDYVEQLAATADRQGGFREMYVNAQTRSIYRNLVACKFKNVHAALKSLADRLHYETHIGSWSDTHCDASTTYFARRLFMEDACMGQPLVAGSPRAVLDEAFGDVLTTLKELMVTVHAGKVSKLREENRLRLDKFSRLVQKTVEAVQDTRNHENGGELDVLDCGLQTTLAALNPLVNIDTQNEPSTTQSSLIMSSIQPCILQWIKLKSCGAQTLNPRVITFSERSNMVGRGECCSGGNGRVRFQCILVTLFMERLAQEFDEWRSQVAETELLNSFEETTEPKTPKKPKRKKPKKASQNLERALELPIAAPAVQEEPEDVVDIVPSPSNSSKASEPETNQQELEHETGRQGIPTNESKKGESKDDGDIQKEAPVVQEPRQELQLSPETSQISVRITSKDGVETLEEFLVGRLRSLLTSGESFVTV